jgi:CrcB protein
MIKYLLILLGAAVGGLARYLISNWFLQRTGGRFPWGTLVVNVTGCFLIGVVMTALTDRFTDPHPNWRMLLVVGVLGGYTTFSAFAWETFLEVRTGHPWAGFWNITLSVVLGYLAVWCGVLVTRR